jgi:hypothetical protein
MKRLLSALVVLTALWLPSQARAQDCPDGTRYQQLWEEKDGDTVYVHYSCVDDACEAEVSQAIEATANECEDLKDRILRFPDVEAHLDQVTADQLRRARQDLVSDVVVMFDEIERAGMGGKLDRPDTDSLGADLARMRSVLNRGGDFWELRPYASRVSKVLEVLGLVDLAADLNAAWQSLQRLIQQETDADRLRAMLESKKLNLEIQLTGCSRRLGEVKERRQGCSRSW